MRPNWLRRLAKSLARPAARKPIRKAALSVQLLEDRSVPTFLPPVSYPVGANPSGITVADLNGDGKDDLAVVNAGVAGSVGVMLSNGDGTFQPKVDYGAGAYALDVKAGDFNGDGKIDLAIVGANSTVSILLGNGDGSFAAPVTYGTGAGAHAINVGDFNNDGVLDVATLNSTSMSVLLGNGDGTLRAHLDAALPGNNTDLVVGDFNNDGNLDLATSNTVSLGTITLLKGHGDGTFDPAQNINANSAPVYLAAGDFNHDGYEDFAMANSYSATPMSVIMNNGNGTYAPPVIYPIAETGHEIEVADFNNDGFEDFAVRGATQYQVEYGKGDGTFFQAQNFTTPAGQFEKGSQHGDFNGDGALDLAYISNAGATVVMNANDSAANQAGAVGFQVSMPATTTAGSALPMTITAVDANGKPATGYKGSVFVTTSDPAVTGTFTYTFTAADAGTHSFTGAVHLVTVGDQAVTVEQRPELRDVLATERRETPPLRRRRGRHPGALRQPRAGPVRGWQRQRDHWDRDPTPGEQRLHRFGAAGRLRRRYDPVGRGRLPVPLAVIGLLRPRDGARPVRRPKPARAESDRVRCGRPRPGPGGLDQPFRRHALHPPERHHPEFELLHPRGGGDP
ncbi:MAG: FG-GAP-like repeat-containing protein [Gemmataceae bacterium]